MHALFALEEIDRDVEELSLRILEKVSYMLLSTILRVARSIRVARRANALATFT